MSKKVLLEPGFVLHNRLYRETSLLIELFTLHHGRVTLIAKGVRQTQSRMSGLLQPFVPLLVSFSGKTELMLLTQVEPHGALLALQGDYLFAGFYLNELLINLLQKNDAHPALFEKYKLTMEHLAQKQVKEPVLRQFEKYLLSEIGYGLLPNAQDADVVFSANQHYRFTPDKGFVLGNSHEVNVSHAYFFLGEHLRNMAKDNWQDDTLREAKRLMRMVLTHLLGARPIHSRRLFTESFKREEHEAN